jgi:Trk-type K+ transport system membrane component
VGKLLIVVLMLVGRLGPLTVALVVGGRDALQRTRLPEEEVLVG